MNKKLIIFLSCASVVAALCVALPLTLKQPVDENEVNLSQVEKVKMDDVEDRLISKAFIDYRIVNNVKYLRYSVAVDASRTNSISILRDTAGYETSVNDIFTVYKGLDFKGTNMYYDLNTNRLTTIKPSTTNYYFACYSVKLQNKSEINREFTFSGSIIGVDNEEYELPVVTASCDDHWDHYSPIASTDTQNGIREFWEDGNGKLAFEKPDSTHITDVGEPERAFIDSLDQNDLRLIPQLGGGINIPTYTNVGWDVKSKETSVKVEFGQTIGSHTNSCAKFSNYQWTGWKESQLGLTATYTNSNPVGVNKIYFVYYLYRYDGGTGVKADLTVTISIIDNFDNKVQIDSFVISKDEPSAWVNYSKNFNLTSFDKLVIETKSELVSLPPDKGINTQLFIDNLLISGNATYTDSISTTDPTNWSSVPRNPNYSQNRIDVPSQSWWDPDKGLGDYLAVRTYQHSTWNPEDAGVTAIYSNPTPKQVNKLVFNYFINTNPAFFVAPEATIKIYAVSGEDKILIDTIELNENTIRRGEIIPYSKSFNNLVLDELHIELFTNAPKGTDGSSVVFFKDMGVYAITGPSIPMGDINISTTDPAYWSHYSSNNDNSIDVGSHVEWQSSGVYLAIRTFQEENAASNTKMVNAIYEKPFSSEIKRVNKIQFTYYLNSNYFVTNSSMSIKITVVGNGKKTLIDTISVNKDSTKDTGVNYSKSFDELVFDGLEIEVTSTFADGTNGSTCFFVKEIKASFVA